MVYPTAHLRLNWGGRLFQDQWQCGINLARPDIGVEPTPAELLAEAAAVVAESDVADAVEDFFTHTDIRHNQGCRLDWIRCAPMGLDGTMGIEAATPTVLIDPAIAGTGTNVHAQLAWCISLRTTVSRGPASHGRIYIPHGTPTTESDLEGRQSVAQASAMAIAAAVRLKAIEDAVNSALGAGPVPYSLVNISKVGAGHLRQVTHVMVGRVVDTQQRRRRQITEDYQTADYDESD